MPLNQRWVEKATLPKFELLHCILMSVAVRNSTESEYKAGNL